ncbi:tetratricopeptide repeat protein [Engelhardtia mirabilis]|uniref:Tetratricopeptide repeat protein n=1 Tax=Engelhardtia mirabilis TaxID=2528011 RepID=A0A518BGP5_9BACT|nr:tetratricopeptide repeat protein [Planctomycetes bacterium Pla133]QDV00420.1 tetratricopeptide repeat protein [Planctomycetes bacterium Pla86]
MQRLQTTVSRSAAGQTATSGQGRLVGIAAGLACLLASCAGTSTQVRDFAPLAQAAPRGTAAASVPTAAALTRASVGSAVAAMPQRRLELPLWTDPKFQRRFTESYMAQTEVEPRLTELERETMQEFLDLMSADKVDQAATLMREQRGDASSAVFDFSLANIHFQADELNQAASAYEAAVEKFPKFLRAWKNLGLVRARQSEFSHAAAAFTEVLELGGGDATTYGLLGIARMNLGQDMAAESAFRMATMLDPVTPDWRMGLARCFFNQKRFAEAVSLTESMIAEDPDRAELWLLQANAFIGQGDAGHAAENYELVDRLGGSTVGSLTTLGDIYVNEKLFDMAADAYARALDMDLSGELARPMRAAGILAARGALEPTRELIGRIEWRFGDALDDAGRVELLKLKARLSLIEGAGDEEAAILEQVVALDPFDGDALLLLGDHARRNDDPQKAIYYYERASNLEEFEAEAKVRHAQVLVDSGDYAPALRLLERAQTLRPLSSVQDYLERVDRVAKNR